jgi:DNA replication and repair protein RecF
LLADFRNYASWEITPDSALTILVGPNAIGKTNVIEAIELVATGASFRNPQWQDVVRWGRPQATIRMSTEGDGSRADVELLVTSEGRRTWRVGGVTKRRTVDATRFVPVVVFTPDDLLMVKGPAEQRRIAIDRLGEQLSATYGSLRRDYARVIRQRNALLRDEGPPVVLEPWDQQLVTLGAKLYVHRRRLLERVAEAARPVYERLSGGERLELTLVEKCGMAGDSGVTQSSVEDALAAELHRRRDDERARKVSLVGPHRDDIAFTIDGHDARAFASQGQQRTIALAWKWAEVAVITEVSRRSPVLLLDDVMSELDATRRRALTDLVQRDVQTFVTTTTTSYFEDDLLHAASVTTLGK